MVFIEKLGFYAIIAMALFLAPGSIMALWGGGIDVISDLTYWISNSTYRLLHHLLLCSKIYIQTS